MSKPDPQKPAQYALKLDAALYQMAKDKAKVEGRTFRASVIRLIEKWVNR